MIASATPAAHVKAPLPTAAGVLASVTPQHYPSTGVQATADTLDIIRDIEIKIIILF
jgi:hypothetical protein